MFSWIDNLPNYDETEYVWEALHAGPCPYKMLLMEGEGANGRVCFVGKQVNSLSNIVRCDGP